MISRLAGLPVATRPSRCGTSCLTPSPPPDTRGPPSRGLIGGGGPRAGVSRSRTAVHRRRAGPRRERDAERDAMVAQGRPGWSRLQ